MFMQSISLPCCLFGDKHAFKHIKLLKRKEERGEKWTQDIILNKKKKKLRN